MNRGYHLRSSSGSIHRADRTSGQIERHIEKIACCIEFPPDGVPDLNKLEP
jgi:hypothetical protein